jgi:hypothetical protein
VKVQLKGWGGAYYYDFICSRRPASANGYRMSKAEKKEDLCRGVPGYWGPVVGKITELGEESVESTEAMAAAVKAAFESPEGHLFRELFGRW